MKKKKKKDTEEEKNVEEKEGKEEGRKQKEEGEKERERVFREVVCGKVVEPCMSKGNNNKNVREYYFNKRWCIIDNLMRVFLQIDCEK